MSYGKLLDLMGRFPRLVRISGAEKWRLPPAMTMNVLPPSETGMIRFGVGSPQEPTSFIWRLRATREDSYLIFGPRHDVKASMHGDVWKIDAGTQRHRFRPIHCPKAPGWIQGPAVMFCHVPYRPTPTPEHIKTEIAKSKNIIWFRTPDEWSLSEFVVFFTETTDAPPPDSTAALQFAIGPLPLETGERIWLRQVTKKIPMDRRAYLLQLRNTVRGMRVDKLAKDLRGIAMVFHLHESSIVAVPFGLETLKTA